jgi:hypothetical protein
MEKINVRVIEPEAKDYERAAGLMGEYDDHPSYEKALRMANAIRDPFKMVRRSKAIVGVFGTELIVSGPPIRGANVWGPFRNALGRMGFTKEQIQIISEFEIDESLLK